MKLKPVGNKELLKFCLKLSHFTRNTMVILQTQKSLYPSQQWTIFADS